MAYQHNLKTGIKSTLFPFSIVPSVLLTSPMVVHVVINVASLHISHAALLAKTPVSAHKDAVIACQ